MGDHDGTLSNGTEFTSDELVCKMTEGVIVFKCLTWVLYGQLQLALYFPHKEVVYHNVIGWIIQLVLDSEQTEVFLD